MLPGDTHLYNDLKFLLEQDYRGVKLGIYAVAAFGLAAAVYRVRPVSKFSKASQVPLYFIRINEQLTGRVVSVEPGPLRLFINHQPPIYLPIWHTKKPPLPVQLWGVEIADGNAIGWLNCVAVGHKVLMKPLSRSHESLFCSVDVHLKNNKTKQIEVVNLGQRLVELGFAKVSIQSPAIVTKDTKKSLESIYKHSLESAESKAKSIRAGVWSSLPPPPLLVVILKRTTAKAGEFLVNGAKSLLQRTWGYIRRSTKKNIKQNIA